MQNVEKDKKFTYNIKQCKIIDKIIKSGVYEMNKIFKSIAILLILSFSIIGCSNNEIVKEDQLGITNEIQIGENHEDEGMEVDNIPEEESIEDNVEEESTVEYINIVSEEVRIPILMYHSISDDDPNNSLLVPPDMFDEQMAWLEENNFTSMSMDEAIEAMNTGKVPKRPVVITFDDGYMDNYTSAFPSLKEHNMNGTFFVITSGVDNGYYMSSDMLREMQDAGMIIENHTENHVELNNLSREEAIDEIRNAQTFLREVIGAEANYLCYPVGRYSDETIEIAKELGIKAAVTTQGGISQITDGNYELKRVRVSPMSIEGFAEIFSEYIY